MIIMYKRDPVKAREIDRASGCRFPCAVTSSNVECSNQTRVVLADGTLTLYGPDIDVEETAVNYLHVMLEQ